SGTTTPPLIARLSARPGPTVANANAAGRPIPNRAAVSWENVSFADIRRPITVPNPHNAAAPAAKAPAVAALAPTSNGSGNVISQALPTANSTYTQNRGES